MKKRIAFFACCCALLLLSSCASTGAPSSLTNTSWKYSTSSSDYQVLDFTSNTGGTYSVTTNGSTSSSSFTYTYNKPDVTIAVKDGDKFDGNFTSSTTLEIILSNSPTAAMKFTKE